MSGNDILNLGEQELQLQVQQKKLFFRMFPEAKMRIINALKRNGEIVAMMGDGVNDAPALKAAHIGIAMGSKGTEIAKEAAALIIINDDLNKLIIAVAAGRRIYANIKKAIQYIISIHIPIILTVSLPLFLGWVYPEIFTPVHVIFLELIMGPTCSIVYENEPMDANTMQLPPRPIIDTFFKWPELFLSITQGLIISAGVLFVYQYAIQIEALEEKTRAMVFSTLIFSNVLLSLVNRSFYYSIFEMLKVRNHLLLGINILVLIMLALILNVPVLEQFFKVTSLNRYEVMVSICVSLISVLWFEGFKWVKRKRNPNTLNA